MQHEVTRGTGDHRAWIEAIERALAPQTPREQDRRGDLIELQAPPKGTAIDEGVCGNEPSLLLDAAQPDERAQRRVPLSGGEQRRGALHEVARPDEVIAADFIVASRLAPRNRQRRDHRTLEKLVFVREQDAPAEPRHASAVGRVRGEIVFLAHAVARRH